MESTWIMQQGRWHFTVCLTTCSFCTEYTPHLVSLSTRHLVCGATAAVFDYRGANVDRVVFITPVEFILCLLKIIYFMFILFPVCLLN